MTSGLAMTSGPGRTPKTQFYARCDECKKYVPLSTLICTSPGTYICVDHQKPRRLENQ